MTSDSINEEVKVQKAIVAYTAGEFTSMAKAARFFNAKYDRVKNRINGRPPQAGQSAYNLLLSGPEEEGLIIWLRRRDALGTRATVQELEWECNCILAARHLGPLEPPTCGDYWTNRFLKRHLEFSLCTKNPKELERQAAEDLIALSRWYQDYNNTVGLYGIEVGDIYNYDETGVCLGRGKKEKVITALKAFRITAAKDTNRESATVVEVISSNRVVGPLLIILASKII